MDAYDRWLAMRKAMNDSPDGPGGNDGVSTNCVIPFIPRPDDVIIVGIGKSGTTWMQQIVHQIRTKGDENFSDIYDVVPFLPTYNQKLNFDPDADQVANPRVFKSHMLYENIPKLDGVTRFVVTTRHPYDTKLSMMKFIWRFAGVDRDMNATEYEKVFGNWRVGDFAKFINSWWPHRNDPNVLIIPYEYLKEDLGSCIQKISNFICGKPLDEADFLKVLHFSSFEYMSQHREKFAYESMAKQLSQSANIEYLPVVGGMVRLDGGQVGQGKKLLDQSIRQQVDKDWKEIVEKQLGFKNYDEFYRAWCQQKKQNWK